MFDRIRNISALAAAVMMSAAITSEAKNTVVPLGAVASELQDAQPGDTIVVKAGEYQDMKLVWMADASAGNPVVVTAEYPGGVVISGKSSLAIHGKGLSVSSLVFRDGSLDKGAVVTFRKGDSLAEDCRLTDCVIDGYNPARRDMSTSYVHLYGKRNRVDHCSFLGKKALGVTMIVWLNYEACLDNHHSIDHNIFGPRPVYGSNGAETIRIGTSQQCMESSRTEVRDNLFLRCNGEVEVISIKSSDNVIADNVLYECQGVLALRHGERNLVEGNVFVGNGVRNTGGVRIVDSGHRVIGNSFYGLAGQRFFSALALMSAVPNSLPNRYVQVEDVDIDDNLFADCATIEFGTGLDYERTLPPKDIRFKGNTICNPGIDVACTAYPDASGIVFEKNKVYLGNGYEAGKGFRQVRMSVPQAPDYSELSAGKGAGWYASALSLAGMQEDASSADVRAEVLYAGAGDDVAAVVASAPSGSTVVLTDSLYNLAGSIEVSSDIVIRAGDGVSPVLKYVGRKGGNMVTICDGGRLHIKGLIFDGSLAEGRSAASAGISTAADMIDTYSLKVEDCTFRNFGESTFFPVKGMKGTFADTVAISGCTFRDLSGDAVNYAAELDDKGRYSADDVIIEDCHFERILGIPVNIARNGSDESTAGPYVKVLGCTFDDCCNKVRGSVIKIIGAQVLDISGCVFNDSGRGGYSVRLDDAPWEKITVEGLSFRNSGGILSNREITL